MEVVRNKDALMSRATKTKDPIGIQAGILLLLRLCDFLLCDLYAHTIFVHDIYTNIQIYIQIYGSVDDGLSVFLSHDYND